jgi:hypothetical protein
MMNNPSLLWHYYEMYCDGQIATGNWYKIRAAFGDALANPREE